MKLAPFAWNLITGGQPGSEAPGGVTPTIANATHFQVGNDAGKLYSTDFNYLTLWRGPFEVEAGINDASNFNDGAAKTATVTPGVYLSPMELAIALAAAHNAVSSNFVGLWRQDEDARYRFELKRTSGTCSLQIASGADTASNILKLLCGYRNQDRSAAATHTGDYAAVHGDDDLSLQIDVGDRAGANVAIIVNPQWSPGGSWSVSMGSTSAATDQVFYASHSFDDELMILPFPEIQLYRYVHLHISDPKREDYPRIGLGYFYYGAWFDLSDSTEVDANSFEVQSLSRRAVFRSKLLPGLSATPHTEEIHPGEVFTVSWQSNPGMGPAHETEIERLLLSLGTSAYLFVILDDQTEPHRDTILARVLDPPKIDRIGSQSSHGRYQITLTLERANFR